MSANFLKEYKKLNPKQKEAVDEIEGPVMVIAGPGTGKTQILAMRIANILRKTQTNASNILCLTFTNSGVQAMRKRLLEIIGPAAYQIHVHTFHSFCNEVIQSFPEKFLTAKDINQLTDLEQIFIIQKILTEGNFSQIKPFKAPFYYQKAIISAIDNLKQENISPQKFKKIIEQEFALFAKIEDLYHEKGVYKGKLKAKYVGLKTELSKNQELAKVFQKYQRELEKQGKYDYSDMILSVVGAFQNDPEILSNYQEKYQYFLIDEYQDTNSAQNEIIRLLGSFYEEPNVFVVGDDEQSIFRFQGASLENILAFTKHYPGAKIIVLECNYRSIQKILDASRAVILNNQNQIFNLLNINKNLKSQLNNVKGNIKVAEFSHGSIESFFVAKKINELIKKPARRSLGEGGGINPSEIAVLYKEHRDSEKLIDFLSKLNIPYIIETGGNILDDPEIDKIITYLQALNFGVKFTDNHLLLEIMHYPFFGISPLDIYKIVASANKERKNIFDIITNKKSLAALELDGIDAVNEFVRILLECRHLANHTTFAHAFEYIINATGYLNYLLSLNESTHHLNRLQTLFDEIKNLNTKNKHLKLSGFLEYISRLQENDLPIKQREISATYEGVHLMTAHKSKGLEFECVFLIHATDKHWGNKVKKELIKLPKGLLQTKTVDDKNDEEERRLFYVALTRAKRHIFLTYAVSYGELDTPTFAVPSKFISEMPAAYCRRINTQKYEGQFNERLKLTFAERKWQPTAALSDFLRGLIKEFKLSPTALNTYLECPQRFFYDNILRVPKTMSKDQAYGDAVHKALEKFFNKYIRDLKLPGKEKLIKYFEEAMEENIFEEKDRIHMLKRGKEYMEKYFDFYHSEWLKKGIPLRCEFNFAKDNVHYGDIPITGKIDRIDLMDKTSNTVKIIDYKTSAPKSLNYLLGLTKEKDTRLLYQAYFYKLLAETDPLFQWRVGEIEFDFLTSEKSANSDEKFKRIALPIDGKKYEEFKKIMKEVYDKIINLEFELKKQTCKNDKGACPYFPICYSKFKI